MSRVGAVAAAAVWALAGLLLAGAVAGGPVPRDPPAVSRKEEAMEKLKQVFGMPSPGARRPRNAAPPPQYMLDLYNSITDVGGVTRIPNPHNARIIRSFLAAERSTTSHLLFDISGVEQDEYVLEAELHVFKKSGGPPGGAAAQEGGGGIFQVMVYQVGAGDGDDPSNATGQKLIGSHYVLPATSGWLVFHVRLAIQEWLQSVSPNRGFLLVARTLLDQAAAELPYQHAARGSPKQPLLVLFNNQDRPQKLPPHKELPVYTVFSVDNILESSMGLEETRKRRRRRSPGGSAEQHEEEEEEEEEQTSPSSSPPPPPASPAAAQTSIECSRYDLFVDFPKIGWSSWIISPMGYNAYTCRGHCDFPLSQVQRPSNHAMVQSTVVELTLEKNATKPCCVPSNLLPISLLYYDNSGNVVIKQYDEMVAEECGCL